MDAYLVSQPDTCVKSAERAQTIKIQKKFGSKKKNCKNLIFFWKYDKSRFDPKFES